MSRDLIPTPHEVVNIQRGLDPLAKSSPRAVIKTQNRIAARALAQGAQAQAAGFVASARVDAAELVTERIMVGLDRLNRVETAMARQDPVKAERFASLVEDFVLIARCELRNLPREF